MKNEEEFSFKVMPWLRKVREENAKETAGMSPKERLAHTKKKAKWSYDSYPEFKQNNQVHLLGEKRSVYNADKTSK